MSKLYKTKIVFVGFIPDHWIFLQVAKKRKKEKSLFYNKAAVAISDHT